jgi:uncharacterized protein YndB with AHSA1/START domain
MSGPPTTPALRLSRRLEHAPARVFEALTRADIYERWMGPDGSTTTIERLEPEVGGSLALLVDIPEGPTVRITGTYREVEPPNRLSHTWLVEGDPAETVVTFELSASGPGKLLELTHEGFTDAADREQNEGGWSHQLDRLERALG